jgi:hypothetical protein
MTKIIALILIIFLNHSANAEPFELDTYGDKQQSSVGITYAKLNRLSNECLYDNGWLDIDVKVKGGISNRISGYVEGQNTFAGLVISVPLYSGKEVDRERNRAYKRKRQVSDDIASMIGGIEKILHDRNMVDIYKIMEVRSQKRVKNGVISLSEQVTILDKLSNLKKEIITFTAQVGGKYTALLNGCKEGKEKKVLKEYMDEELHQLKIIF